MKITAFAVNAFAVLIGLMSFYGLWAAFTDLRAVIGWWCIPVLIGGSAPWVWLWLRVARLGRAFGSSLVTAGGLAYFLADDGVTQVVEPGKELKIVAENPLGEFTNSSPAISQGRIYIRGERHLWAIGPREAKSPQVH